jgi:hypothetical protein
MLFGCTKRHSEWFYVTNSELLDVTAHHSLLADIKSKGSFDVPRDFVVTGHRIKRGVGSIIAFRDFDSGSQLITDQAAFQKLTVFLPGSIQMQKTKLKIVSDRPITAYYSRSSSNFPGVSGCIGYALDGSIEIKEKTADHIQIKIDLTFELMSPAGWQEQCGSFTLSRTAALQKKRFDKLTPWEGVEGDTLYDESMWSTH